MVDPESRLAECLRLMEEQGDIARCLELYPDLASELAGHAGIAEALNSIAVRPGKGSQAASRRLLLTSLSQAPGGVSGWRRWVSGRAVSLAAATAVFVAGAVGAGAATSSFNQPMSEVLSAIGLGGQTHGEAVSDAVFEAIEETEPGPERGLAVSTAACEAAHDRSTLPEPAQLALADKDASDCSDDAVEESEEALSAEAVEAAGAEQKDAANHGTSVADAVHQSQEATPPGPERGRAVSEAACEAAHDRTTLPSKANQAPPGRANQPPKDCTHPNSEAGPGDDD